jgi:hypothetical protein
MHRCDLARQSLLYHADNARYSFEARQRIFPVVADLGRAPADRVAENQETQKSKIVLSN